MTNLPASLRIVLFLCVASLSFAQSTTNATISPVTHTPPSSSSPKLHPAPQNFEQFAVYWTDEAGWHSELQLRNNLVDQALTVTPALRSSDGNEMQLAPVTIRPSDVVSVQTYGWVVGPVSVSLMGCRRLPDHNPEGVVEVVTSVPSAK